MNLNTYTVKVYLYHSTIYASAFLPSSYESTPDLQLPNPAALSVPNSTLFERLGGYMLQGEQPPSTTLLAVKQLLQEQFHIPLSIQSHFKDFGTTTNGRYDVGKDFKDETTLQEVWEDMHEEDHEDFGSEAVLVTLATTAGRLWEMEDSRRGTALVGKLWSWRHYAAGLRYLRYNRETSLDLEKREQLDRKFEEYERLERSTGEDIRQSLWDWYRLVDGVAEAPFQEKETPEAREQDIESRFGPWMERKQDALQKYRQQENSAPKRKQETLYKEDPEPHRQKQQKCQESDARPKPAESLPKSNLSSDPSGEPQTVSFPSGTPSTDSCPNLRASHSHLAASSGDNCTRYSRAPPIPCSRKMRKPSLQCCQAALLCNTP